MVSCKIEHHRLGRGFRWAILGYMVALAIFITATDAGAQVRPGLKSKSELGDIYLRSHQVGGRLGGWANQGGSSPRVAGDQQVLDSARTDFGSGSFYLEGFVAYRIQPWLAGEFSLGIATRGDVTEFYDDGGSSIGTLSVYPILLKAKFYPPLALFHKFYPYFTAGGGIYYGKQSIQFVNSPRGSLEQSFDEESQTTFSYVLGGGVDWPLASVVALDLNVQYMPIEFDNPLFDIKDYSSLTITVGVKYLFTGKEQDER